MFGASETVFEREFGGAGLADQATSQREARNFPALLVATCVWR